MAWWHILLLGPLVVGVLWQAQVSLRVATDSAAQPHPSVQRALLMLFAWSLVLGAVIRWIRL